MFTKLKKPVPERDRVVIVEDEAGTADIATVYNIDDKAIYAESSTQDYAIPMDDVRHLNGPHGRIFLLCASSQYVNYTKSLARLQESMVLEKVTVFRKEAVETGSGIRIKDILMYALIGVLVLGVIFK